MDLLMLKCYRLRNFFYLDKSVVVLSVIFQKMMNSATEQFDLIAVEKYKKLYFWLFPQ